jgi:hypothetical protein
MEFVKAMVSEPKCEQNWPYHCWQLPNYQLYQLFKQSEKGIEINAGQMAYEFVQHKLSPMDWELFTQFYPKYGILIKLLFEDFKARVQYAILFDGNFGWLYFFSSS